VRSLFLEAANPSKTKDLTIVQAGGTGRYYDADDRTRAVDFDFLETKEDMGGAETESADASS
jgi:hypothetical protein